MRTGAFSRFLIVLFLAGCLRAQAADPNTVLSTNSNNPAAGLVKFTVENQYDKLSPGTKTALAVTFEVNKDWHFYADSLTAPGGTNLKVKASANSDAFKFGEAVVPKGIPYQDEFTGTTTNVLSEKFTIYLPYEVSSKAASQETHIDLTIEGALCSAQQCRTVDLPAQVKVQIEPGGATTAAKFKIPATIKEQPVSSKYDGMENYPVWAALFMAFVAGIILNIMPCVLPVIPLKVLSIFEQAKQSKFRCITLGLAFCVGILIFFAVIAGINIVLRIGYDSVFQWGDHFRNPIFIIGMALLMEVLALTMFGVATVTVPSRMTEALPKKGGYSGSVGMGFLAALLSTPCSFAILTAAFAWAQTQTLLLSTAAIMAIGLGMAAPYAVLTSLPSLLRHLPKPGHWMEIFKRAMGFLLLVVALWLITILPVCQQANILYYAMILAFCVWMWGGWVNYDSTPPRRWFVRIAAVFIAFGAAGPLLMSNKIENMSQQTIVSGGITWRPYEAAEIKQAVADGKPVLIEFTADWCLTCKAVEKTVFARKDIQDLIKQKGVLTIRGDATWANNPATIDLKKVYSQPGVPVTILYVPGRSEPVKFQGMLIGSELKQALEKL